MERNTLETGENAVAKVAAFFMGMPTATRGHGQNVAMRADRNRAPQGRCFSKCLG